MPAEQKNRLSLLYVAITLKKKKNSLSFLKKQNVSYLECGACEKNVVTVQLEKIKANWKYFSSILIT